MNQGPSSIDTSLQDGGDQLDDDLQLLDFSHYPLPKKTKHTLRLFYNNINGLEINVAVDTILNNKKVKRKNNIIQDFDTYTKLEAFVKQIYTWDVDVSALAEPCIEWRDTIPRKIVKDIGKKYDRGGNWTVATSSCYSSSFVKPGGALIYSAGQVSGKILERGTDPWNQGRWSYVRYQGQAGASLMVIGAYRVGARSGIAGASTAWHQQKVLLSQEKRVVEPEEAFLQDFEQWYRLKIQDKTEVIMFIDANEQWTEQSKIRQMANNLQLVNLNIAGSYNFPASHPSITNRQRDTTIDYCLCTSRIVEATNYATMAPFDLYTLGDHRGMLVDIDIKKILHSQHTDVPVSVGRKLATNNPKATAKYLEQLEASFDKQNIFERTEKLFYQWRNKEKNRWEVMKTYEKLDKEIFHLCRKAEIRCRATVSGKYQWSPILAKAIKTLAYWRARKRYGVNYNGVVKKLEGELGLHFEFKTESEIQMMIQESKVNLQRIQQNDVKYRQEHLESIARKYSNENNVSQATAVSELLSHESLRTTFSLLKEKMKRSNNGQLKKVWIALDDTGQYVKDDASKIEVVEPTEVHKLLLHRNKKHLGQAKRTPFARGKWAQALKWDGTGDLGKDILSGSILNKEKFTSTVQLYFESLKTTRLTGALKIIEPQLTIEEYKQFWKKKKEETVTSPFGLHVGHFKAALQNVKILNVHRIMLLLPFQTALVPHRWKKTVQTMLEKDPGHPWIHRLRIIELFDAQVNAGFQLFIGRHMVWAAVNQRKLHDASYGSTPGKMAASALLLKVLSIDQLRIERRAGGLFDCDATGCYDRILPPLASVHLQALGLSSSIATLLARLMFVAKRYVKTKHGVSVHSIRTTLGDPLFGIGQGNGGGPAIWLAHLTVMFTALSAICQGLVIYCLKGIEKLVAIGTGYVDDVTLIASLHPEEPQTEKRVRNKLKLMASRWEKLLYLTGGKLELSKCFWIPIVWEWRKGEPVLLKKKRQVYEMILTESESGNKVRIPRSHPTAAEKRLGVRYSTDGKWTREFVFWKEFSADFATKVRRAKMDRAGGYHTYNTLWCSKFRFGAPVVSFTEPQLIQIQKKIIGPCLTASGYNSKMPRAVVFGTSLYGGMNWTSPLVMQMYEQIKIIIGSIRLSDTVGKLLLLQLQWLQLQAGTEAPILDTDKEIPYLQSCWLQSLHSRLVNTAINIKVVKQWIPKPRREDDFVIMDYVRNNLPETHWAAINQCRLYLEAITLSDLVTFDGTTIPDSIFQVRRYRKSRLRFPHQKRPPKQSRAKWQYLVRYISDESGLLYTPLGRWLRKPYQEFPYIMGKNRAMLYVQKNSHWEIYYLRRGSRNVYLQAGMTVTALPKQWIPINVIRLSNMNMKVICPNETYLDRDNDGDKSVGFFNEESEKQIVGEFEVNTRELEKLVTIWGQRQVTLLCGSDGGLKEAIGTSGYVLYVGESDTPLVYGYSAEQQFTTASSTRQELLAQLCIEYWVDHLISKLGEPGYQLTVKLVTDSKASIDILENMSRKIGMNEFLKPDMDVAMTVDTRRTQRLHCQLEVIKVNSHIGIDEAPDEFYWRLNEEADKLATLAREKVESGLLEARSPVLLPESKVICSIAGKLCVNTMKDSIHTVLTKSLLQEYLCLKYGWTDSVWSTINWKAHQEGIAKYQILPKVTVMKYIHGWLATTKRRWREGELSTPLCLLCDTVEDRGHMFCCQNSELLGSRLEALRKLDEQVRKITQPEVADAIAVGVRSIGNDTSAILYRQEFVVATDVSQAMFDQEQIGWDHFLMGRIALKWSEIGPAENHRDKPQVWGKKIVDYVLGTGIELWKQRNQLIHGSQEGVSKVEAAKTLETIRAIYNEIYPNIHPSHRWLFPGTVEDKLAETRATQIAWIDGVRRLYPTQYADIQTIIGKTDFRQETIEYIKARSRVTCGG